MRCLFLERGVRCSNPMLCTRGLQDVLLSLPGSLPTQEPSMLVALVDDAVNNLPRRPDIMKMCVSFPRNRSLIAG